MPEDSPRRRRVADDTPAVLEQPFHTKYRPQCLSDVRGQDHVVDSLNKVIRSKTPGHAYLFTGPAGTGKTTLARILAAYFKCDMSNVTEVDAATNSGVDAMRDVMSAIRYQGFGEQPNKAIIIDECHALSKQAWSSLLKPVEEPPPHVFIFFCTTETGKVPDAIVTRCHSYPLKPLKYDHVMDLLCNVADLEQLRAPESVLSTVARASGGSARQALVMLSMVRDVTDPGEAAAVLESPLENKEVIDLCRMLIKRDLSWPKLVETLKGLSEMSPESIRIVVLNYLAACAMGAKRESDVPAILDMMAQFSKPFNTSDKQAPLLLAFGNLIYP